MIFVLISTAHKHAEHLLHHLLYNKSEMWEGNIDGFKVLIIHLAELFAVDMVSVIKDMVLEICSSVKHCPDFLYDFELR